MDRFGKYLKIFVVIVFFIDYYGEVCYCLFSSFVLYCGNSNDKLDIVFV